jgi:hypothetical protein
VYGKHFAQMYTGSLYGQPALVFAVWGYAIANARPSRRDGESYVEMNPTLLAATFATTVDAVAQALRFLESPDPNSRRKVEQGRRLMLIGDDNSAGPRQYRVVNGRHYRDIRDEDQRREQNRNAKRRQRAKEVGAASISRLGHSQPASGYVQPASLYVSHCQPASAQEEGEEEREALGITKRERGSMPASARRAREAKAKRIASWLAKNCALRCLACGHERHVPRRCALCDECDSSETTLKDGLGGAFEAEFQIPWNAWTEQRAELETM